ncbi:MAG TPA: FlgO family outer membrane protein [Vicinamibacterales bacterium]
MALSPGTRLGPYEIEAPLGAGGMGEVYRAVDSRLGRHVAVKVLRPEVARDPERRARFEREARAVAALNHPGICAVHDIGAHDDTDFLVMELLRGESLAARLSRGRLALEEALGIGQSILRTLSAVHERGLVHRDLKPANIFLTPHGVKLLDFGLVTGPTTDAAETRLTQDGMLVGTPRYMAPEQLRGGKVDHRTDIFAAGALIYEMLAGRAAFDSPSLIDLIHAIVFEEPQPLPPGAAPPAVEAALRRALAKNPEERHDSAAAFLSVLRADADATTTEFGRPRQPSLTRLIVLPFRLLKPDTEIDFLGFSLPDAVSAALASLDSVVVRSPLSAGAGGGTGPQDLRTLATEAQVDAVVTGTLLRVGNQVRVAARLVAVPDGSLLWSHTIQAPVDDLFHLQDALTNAIVSALHVPLSARDYRTLRQDVPANPEAYELFLRANQLAADSSRWLDARALYEQALDKDPGYAPAWARFGRVLRVLAKYGGSEFPGERVRAERAFERALALNPDLAAAHNLYAHVEAETGRAMDAMVRLLTRARARTSPDLFAGLVTTCRYCGLLDASLAAYERVRALDPATPTSVAHTYFHLRDLDQAIATDCGSPPYASILSHMRRGDLSAVPTIEELERANPHAIARLIGTTYRLALLGDIDGLRPKLRELLESSFTDPEGFFLLGTFVARTNAPDVALPLLERAVRGGFSCPHALRTDPFWDPLRGEPQFERLAAEAETASSRAREAFEQAGGRQLLEV